MAQQVAMSVEGLQKWAKLADLLEQAGKIAREISRRMPLTPRIPALKRPAHVPAGQEWFWSDEWQEGERGVNEDLAAGRFTVFETVDEAARWLQG